MAAFDHGRFKGLPVDLQLRFIAQGIGDVLFKGTPAGIAEHVGVGVQRRIFRAVFRHV